MEISYNSIISGVSAHICADNPNIIVLTSSVIFPDVFIDKRKIGLIFAPYCHPRDGYFVEEIKLMIDGELVNIVCFGRDYKDVQGSLRDVYNKLKIV